MEILCCPSSRVDCRGGGAGVRNPGEGGLRVLHLDQELSKAGAFSSLKHIRAHIPRQLRGTESPQGQNMGKIEKLFYVCVCGGGCQCRQNRNHVYTYTHTQSLQHNFIKCLSWLRLTNERYSSSSLLFSESQNRMLDPNVESHLSHRVWAGATLVYFLTHTQGSEGVRQWKLGSQEWKTQVAPWTKNIFCSPADTYLMECSIDIINTWED